MKLICVVAVGVAASVTLAVMAKGQAQEYPVKPIHIYTNVPGGTFDFSARVIAQGLAGPLGQSLIVDNRSGNVIPAQIVAKAPPDGYSLMFHGNALHIGALLQKLTYDPIADFAPISMVASAPMVVVIHPSVPVKSVKELIALAKAKPGVLNYGSSGLGSTPHLAMELFKYMTGADITHIPYKGAGPAAVALVSGQVHLMFSATNSAVPQMKTGRLRALAVTSAQPWLLLPGLPTVAASGVPGYESVGIYGLFAPAKTPDAIIRRLYQETVRFLATEEGKKRFFDAGLEPVASTPEEFAAKLKGEMVRMEKVIKAANIRLD